MKSTRLDTGPVQFLYQPINTVYPVDPNYIDKNGTHTNSLLSSAPRFTTGWSIPSKRAPKVISAITLNVQQLA